MHRIHRRRRSSVRVPPGTVVVAVAVFVLAGAHHGGSATATAPAHTTSVSSPAAPSRAAPAAVALARAQIGKPYVYNTTGPDSFDCSGLVQAAWAAAGVAIPRTSEGQWSGLPHVSTPQPGDLILYTGSPIDPPPGHVTMYLGGGQMIEAYGAGYPVRITAVRPGAWGYARPGAGW